MTKKKNQQNLDEIKNEEASERTIVTSIERVSTPKDERAFILFISGPLIGKMYLLEAEKTVIGRAPEVDISINDSRISRKHLRISLKGGQATIEDLGSTNGTFVNGERIRERILQSGDRIHISSDTFFKFAVGDAAERMFQEEMHQMANFDAVTGVLNKHAFARRIQEEFSYAKRREHPLSILMIDIDFFKKVNDTYGHMAGDYVLHGVAQRIKKSLRDEDILARYGGEEFVVILRATDIKNSILLADRIRALVEKDPFRFEKHDIPVTISVGVATLSGEEFANADAFIAHADECLYKSKTNGRNRVTA